MVGAASEVEGVEIVVALLHSGTELIMKNST